MKLISIIYLVIFSAVTTEAICQKILIDQEIEVAGLRCFPLVDSSTLYLYLPSEAGIILNKDDKPCITYTEYKDNEENGKTNGALYLLVNYSAPDAQIQEALDQLKVKLNNKEIEIKGPVDYGMTMSSLVYSIMLPNSGDQSFSLISQGNTPAYEQNGMLNLSFDIDSVAAQMFISRIKDTLSDIHLLLELRFAGWTDNYNAQVGINWDKISSNSEFDLTEENLLNGTDVTKKLNNLMQQGLIKIDMIGSNDKMGNLINSLYDQLGTQLFDMKTSNEWQKNRSLFEEEINRLLLKNGKLNNGNTTKFGVHIGYKANPIAKSGKELKLFDKQLTVNRPHYILRTIDDLFTLKGSKSNFIRKVSPGSEIIYREIFIAPDFLLVEEIGKYIDSVSITFRKPYEGQWTALDKMVLSSANINSSNSHASFIYSYLYKRDSNRQDMLHYEFKPMYYFDDGQTYSADWNKSDWAALMIASPYNRRKIDIETDFELLKKEKIKRVKLKLEYDFFGRKNFETIYLDVEDEQAFKTIEITLPHDENTLNYTIDFIMDDGSIVTQSWEDDQVDSYVFITPPKK